MLPDSSYVRKIILGSVPLMMLLTFLVSEAYQRSKVPPYAIPEDGNVEIESYTIDLKGVVFVFLWVAFLCLVLVVYCLHTMPRKRSLLRKFLEEGQATTGDVFFSEDQTCYGACAQYGTVTYGHPRAEQEHSFVRRSVRLYQNFSREWVSILVLPSRPYSGHPKADIEMAYLATDRQKPAMQFLALYSMVWFVANVIASAYVLTVVDSNQVEDEMPKGWMWFCITLAAMPVVAVLVNFIIFQRYMRWMSRGDARVLAKGDLGDNTSPSKTTKSSSSGNAGDDYQPMPEGGQADISQGDGIIKDKRFSDQA